MSDSNQTHGSTPTQKSPESEGGCPLCGQNEPHEHIISDPLPPGDNPTYEQLAADSMAAWCKEEREDGAGGCGACAICCGELRDQLETLKNTVRLAYSWSQKKECWAQARDVLRNQMHAMGELE